MDTVRLCFDYLQSPELSHTLYACTFPGCNRFFSFQLLGVDPGVYISNLVPGLAAAEVRKYRVLTYIPGEVTIENNTNHLSYALWGRFLLCSLTSPPTLNHTT